jgi:hypothetical protein
MIYGQPMRDGLLNSPDLWNWLGYAFVLTLALFLVPGQLRESVGRLWGPVAAWIARLSVRWMWEGLFISGSVLGLVRPFLCWDDWPEDEDDADEWSDDVLWGTGPSP